MTGGWYCDRCGFSTKVMPTGFVTCPQCHGIGLRGYDRTPYRITCSDHPSWRGWDDGGVNNDFTRHRQREHVAAARPSLARSRRRLLCRCPGIGRGAAGGAMTHGGTTVKYVCTKCGGSNVTLLASRPSLDDRYGVGYCDRCTPVPAFDPSKPGQTKPVNRSTAPLIRADLWNPDALAERDRQRREKRLVEAVIQGKPNVSQTDRERAAEIRRRWEAEAAQRRRP